MIDIKNWSHQEDKYFHGEAFIPYKNSFQYLDEKEAPHQIEILYVYFKGFVNRVGSKNELKKAYVEGMIKLSDIETTKVRNTMINGCLRIRHFSLYAGFLNNKTHSEQDGITFDFGEEGLLINSPMIYIRKHDLDVLARKFNIPLNKEFFSERKDRTGAVCAELSENERTTLLKMILGMAKAKYGYVPKSERNTATGAKVGSIYADLENEGLSVDVKTIRKHLNVAVEKFN